MGLSWGRRPPERHHATGLAQVALALATVLAGVAGSAVPTLGRPVSIIEADTRRQIQETLDQHVEAIVKRDLFVYQRTIDRRNAAFDRCMRELFDLGDLRVQGLRPERIVGLSPVSPNLVRVRVEQRNGVATVYVRRLAVVSFLALPPFDIRRVFYVWYVSPPDPAEVGERRTRTVDATTLTYWEVDERLSGPLLREAALAREFASAHAPRPLSAGLHVRLAGDRELSAAPRTCLTAGRYDAAPDEVVLYRYWEQGDAPSERMRRLLRHEVLHWAQRSSVTSMDLVDHWLREGWPQYVVGEDDFDALMRAQVCAGSPPTGAELVRGPAASASGERALVIQAAERSLVEHMYRAGADERAYWEIVTALGGGMPRDETYRSVLGTSFERLRADWLALLMAAC